MLFYLHFMQACVDWVLRIFGTQVTRKKQPIRPVFPDYLSVSYDYGFNNNSSVPLFSYSGWLGLHKIHPWKLYFYFNSWCLLGCLWDSCDWIWKHSLMDVYTFIDFQLSYNYPCCLFILYQNFYEDWF